MRIQSSVTAISWIPSEAVAGMNKLPYEMGLGHYDPPPPDLIENLEALRRADRFRFANELRAWIDVEDGRIVGHGQDGGDRIGSTTLRIGPKSFATGSPWGDEGSPTLVTVAETALERQLSATIMQGGPVAIRKLAAGKALVAQGDPGSELESSYSTASWSWRSPASGWPKWARGPSSENGQSSRVDAARRCCGPSPR